jgi:hypothetical protein
MADVKQSSFADILKADLAKADGYIPLLKKINESTYENKKMTIEELTKYVETGGASQLTANKTVNLTSSMTAAQIQALIDAEPKNLGGFTLTFQFADGTYTINNEIAFVSFYNGTLVIQGNPTNNTLSSSKNVILNFTAIPALSGIRLDTLLCKVFFRYIRVQTTLQPGITKNLVFIIDSLFAYFEFNCVSAPTHSEPNATYPLNIRNGVVCQIASSHFIGGFCIMYASNVMAFIISCSNASPNIALYGNYTARFVLPSWLPSTFTGSNNLGTGSAIYT